jgi:hypothetical protein
MTPYELTVLAASGAILALAVWVLLRRRSPRHGGPFPDVPDASPTAMPLAAPGMTPPYSSLDPFAPPKQPADWSRTDRPGTPD